MNNEEIKMEVEQFKRELESISYYNRKLIKINLELVAVGAILYEAGTVDYNKQPSTPDPYRNNKLGLIMKEEKLIKEALYYESKIRYCSNVLNQCTKLSKKALIEKYVLGKS